MIRRKNHNKQTQNFHNNHLPHQSFQNPAKINKFNYQVHSFFLDNQSALNKQSLAKKKPNRRNQSTSKNKQNCQNKKNDDSLLRKTYCYEKSDLQLDQEFLNNMSNKYQARLSAQGNLPGNFGFPLESSRSPLKQRFGNQFGQTQRAEEETARKSDNISFRQKKQLMRTNRNSLIEIKKYSQEDQLQARYQELWNYNQKIKNNSLTSQSSALQNNARQILSQLNHQNTIVNERTYASNLIQPERQLRKYSTMKSERKSSINSEVEKRKAISSALEIHASQNCRAKHTSPNSRPIYPSKTVFQQRKLTKIYNQFEFPSPNIKIPANELTRAEDTDLNLKIVQDFSSKISLRIKQLKASMEDMRINKK